MRRHSIDALACITLLATFSACTDESSPGITAPRFDQASAPSGPSASGHANWINPAGETVRRSFYARVMPDGTVRGEFIQHVTAVTGEVRKNQAEIDCMRFLAPNDVMMSGVVKVNLNPALIGQINIFRVIDNGEGGDAVDQLSGVVFRPVSANLDCRTYPPIGTRPSRGGNIQVRP